MEEEHDHDEDINSVQFCLDSPVDARILTQRIKELVAREEIYRVKGFVNVANKPMRMVLQGVGDRFDSFFDRPWQSTEMRQTRLVFIGRSLDSQRIEQALTRVC